MFLATLKTTTRSFSTAALTWIGTGFFSSQFVGSLPNIRSNVGNKVIPPSSVNIEAVVRTIWGRLAKMKTNTLTSSGTIDSHKEEH